MKRFFLSVSDREIARSFLQQQRHPKKAKQVYLNTLAVLAVKFQLQCLGFTPQWESCDSHDLLAQSLFDAADLDLENIGKIECRPVLPDEEMMQVPAEVWSDRIAYIAVGLNRELTEAKILGFVEKTEEEEVPLSQLRSPDELLEFLDRNMAEPPSICLSEWLGQSIDSAIARGWQALEDISSIYSLQPAYHFRSKGSAAKRGKIFNLERENACFALLIGIQGRGTDMHISAEVYPTGEQTYLPPNLKLNILNDVGLSVMEAISQQTKNIQMEFKGEIGEMFQVKISLEQMCLIESFTI
ncbi:DUF1822 family protein [Roseofilum casamattae]|uniref:DUF1822 family protein n=1 Tax=Roseofilum casamattae BLCC-M143 TaxID=3022442 RepID=A0ABT7BWB1_9CYAN|nr:DUF1822 family protein [Roseofilum casamattae]MDJ1183097.1 DUF1822 family protein [Roseofilum casamattae BLCC-M143]